MKLAVIGVGQAGGRLVDAFLEFDQETGGNVVRSALAINTADTDLQGLELLPQGNRLLIGQSRVKGHGVGADNDLAAEIAQAEMDEITGALDSVPVHEIDAFLVVAALGGGTGSGAGPVIIKRLQRLYTEPIYALGVLPAGDEGGLYSMNAARSLQTYVREADNLFVVDNDAWRESGESVGEGYEAINEEVARRFGVLFSAGEIQAGGDVGQSVVDSSEVINTLSGGGVSTMGYASEQLDTEGDGGLLSRFSEEDDDAIEAGATDTNRITSLVRKATLGRLTLPCEIRGIEKALVVVAGPPDHLNRKGIERARSWLEEETGSLEVRGGDYPLPGENSLAAAVLLSGVTQAPRIAAVQEAGVAAKESQEAAAAEHEADMEDMLDDGVDPLF